MPMGTKWFLTDQKAKEFPGGPRGHFRKGHYRNSEVQRRGKEKECSLELKLSARWGSRAQTMACRGCCGQGTYNRSDREPCTGLGCHGQEEQEHLHR